MYDQASHDNYAPRATHARRRSSIDLGRRVGYVCLELNEVYMSVSAGANASDGTELCVPGILRGLGT
jgi:hypothetical protein